MEQLRKLEIELHQFDIRSNHSRLNHLIHSSFFEIGYSGNIYSKKDINWDYVYRLTNEHRQKKIKDNDLLFSSSLEYNLNFKNPLHVTIDKGFVEVLDGATGFMLIKRGVLIG